MGPAAHKAGCPLGDVLILLLVDGFEPFVAWLTVFYRVKIIAHLLC